MKITARTPSDIYLHLAGFKRNADKLKLSLSLKNYFRIGSPDSTTCEFCVSLWIFLPVMLWLLSGHYLSLTFIPFLFLISTAPGYLGNQLCVLA